MKKQIALVILTLFFPAFAFATSGACSGHGGVNCAAGQDRDGSVICNDGWKNSSVQYSSMVMCAGYDLPKKTETKITKPVIQNKIIEEPAQSIPVVKTPSVTTTKVEVKSEIKKIVPVVTPKTVEKIPEQQIKIETVKDLGSQQKTGFWSKLFSFIF